MELKLYNYLRKEGLTHPDVDFRETVYQDKLELYDATWGVDNGILNSVQKYLKDYVQTYIREEGLQESLTRNIGHFSRFLEVASFSQGSIINISEIASAVKAPRILRKVM